MLAELDRLYRAARVNPKEIQALISFPLNDNAHRYRLASGRARKNTAIGARLLTNI
ncbi:hypothetical protein SG35_013060 [Thalassomonas actiniarum]|uniref:Uncharacterized protein n=1 Tax=Thalassomonas actiniarum TaxID=485447 RepID=A0AAF0C5T1_9GAMM|nr:hypothetical protein SG35_013060 [Thalassomonas actiniarum]